MTQRTQGQRIMHRGYADILKACEAGATWVDVAARLTLSRVTAQTLLHAMVDLGLLHEAEATAVVTLKRRTLTPLYRPGAGGRIEWPGRKPRAKQAPPSELIAFASVVRALQVDSLNAKQISQRTGLGQGSAQRLIRHMHALRLIHIDDYPERSHGGYGYPVFTWGDEPDAAKPAPRGRKANADVWNARIAARRQHARMLGLLPAQNEPQFTRQA